MSNRSPHPLYVREALSLEGFCRALDLSKRRVHELQQRGVLPKASLYCIRSRRPLFFIPELYDALEVKRRNIGINGEVVSFNKPRQPNKEADHAT
jgi:hypothetical protein